MGRSIFIVLYGLTFFFFSNLALANSSTLNQLPTDSRVYSRLPKFTDVHLSPSGDSVAFVQNFLQPEIALLQVFNIRSGKTVDLLKTDNENIKINWFHWANEETLIVSALFSMERNGVNTYETRLLATDITTKKSRLIVKQSRLSNKTGVRSQFQDQVIDFLPEDPEHILIALDSDVLHEPSVFKLNINTGKQKRIEKGKLRIRTWMTDRQSNLRLGHALNYKTGETKIWVKRGPTSKKWETLFEYNALDDLSQQIIPAGFSHSGNTLYYQKYLNDKLALFKVNLETNHSELVYSDPKFDVNGGLVYSKMSQQVIGVRHSNSPSGVVYWGGTRDKLQKGLDLAFPDTSNYVTSFNQDENVYLSYSESDHIPGRYYLGDRKTGSLNHLFLTYPEITADTLIEHKKITYKARDGLEIEAFLTLPHNSKTNLPTILYPHGGPGSRTFSGFDYWTSFFVSRGFAVLRPNFRGSEGFGFEFAQSQVGAWGLQMQDDLTDATHWMIDEGISNPEKVCIVGASYGGYAALMATVKTPDLFKCAISFAGVSDLSLLVRESKRFLNAKFVKQQIGSERSDLKARSPYHNVDKIITPILLLHGEEDATVDIKHSEIMYKALKKQDKSVKYVELENGDHFLSIQRNRRELFDEMDAFLREHIGI
ncbi:S9 family peptidase [Alteromonas sp. 5E99-2]|uniref:alpha/beta hydrolase family protein n=1 Tax=Alteromonas sp. 5E99-2 TaxID=2817683 RepID=UPI001A993032|nr:S9 family peptidase [Alteromonas sp. 5E99-2]MBO1254565.1 S9 family peptidase [Alteromonas sp. 5E99-2]